MLRGPTGLARIPHAPDRSGERVRAHLGKCGLILVLLAGRPAAAQVAPANPVLHGNLSYDIATGEAVLKDHPSVRYGDTLLTADVFRYNEKQGLILGIGHFVLTSGSERILAARGSYNLATRQFTLTDVRAGRPPYYITAASASGTRERMTLIDATVYYHEPGAMGPALSADRLIYEPGRRIAGLHGRLKVGPATLIPLPSFDQSLNQPLLTHATTRVGYQKSLGAFVDLGLHVPVAPGINLGGDIGVYTARGLLLGPGGDYQITAGDDTVTGSFNSGFIDDHGDRKTDLLGRPVPAQRGFFDWTHQQTIGDHLSFMGQFSWWGDSEVLRDFHPNQFYAVQQPDSFFEGDYTGDNYIISAFTRVDPNNFEVVQQRLPEVSFNLLPLSIGHGIYEHFTSSFAVLQQDPLISGSTVRSQRFDAYYALERPISPTPWLTIDPVVGGRLTYYADAMNGRSEYTRWLGEVGVDAQLQACGIFNYNNALWGIHGLRHLLTPTLSYRYIPEADRGQPYIPQIDQTVFSTEMQPLDLGDMRNIDDLQSVNTVRLGLDNLLQTRDPTYGSRDLVRLDVATDLNFSTNPGQEHWSDIYTRLSLTPAPWLTFNAFQRLDPQNLALREFNTGLQFSDQKWWNVRLSTAYLQDQINQYFLSGDRRLNEVWHAYTRIRYDALARRWDEVTVGLRQNFRNTWSLRYEMSWYQGNLREAGFGFHVAVDLIRF